MNLRTAGTTLILTAALSGLPPSRVAAQVAQPPQATRPAPNDTGNAVETRGALREVLAQYPPSLAQVLRLDPALLTKADYLAPYPALAAFLNQHPDVARNPGFYLGDTRYVGGPDELRRYTIQQVEESLTALAVFLFFMTALGVAAHVARSILEHRRWLYATRIQTEAHTKLLDRFASNEDLLVYMQSAAGQRFLAAAPAPVEAEARPAGAAPIGRILTSVQAGVVAACGGIGLWIANENIIEEVAQPLNVIAILAIALGVGFVLSAIVSYVLSRQLGLLRSSSSHA